jgi:hypothetical protein
MTMRPYYPFCIFFVLCMIAGWMGAAWADETRFFDLGNFSKDTKQDTAVEVAKPNLLPQISQYTGCDASEKWAVLYNQGGGIFSQPGGPRRGLTKDGCNAPLAPVTVFVPQSMGLGSPLTLDITHNTDFGIFNMDAGVTAAGSNSVRARMTIPVQNIFNRN